MNDDWIRREAEINMLLAACGHARFLESATRDANRAVRVAALLSMDENPPAVEFIVCAAASRKLARRIPDLERKCNQVASQAVHHLARRLRNHRALPDPIRRDRFLDGLACDPVLNDRQSLMMLLDIAEAHSDMALSALLDRIGEERRDALDASVRRRALDAALHSRAAKSWMFTVFTESEWLRYIQETQASLFDLVRTAGVDGWKRLPPAARAAILERLNRHAHDRIVNLCADEMFLIAVWDDLDDHQRNAVIDLDSMKVVHALASSPPDLQRWTTLPRDVRMRVIANAAAQPHGLSNLTDAAALLWNALDHEERACFARRIVTSHHAVAQFLAGIAARNGDATAAAETLTSILQRSVVDMLIKAIPQQRSSLFADKNLRCLCQALGALWSAMDDAQRMATLNMLGDVEAIVQLMSAIRPPGWTMTAPDARMRIIRAFADAATRVWSDVVGQAAANVWVMLDDDERAMATDAICHAPAAVAAMMQRLASLRQGEGWRATPADLRARLLSAVRIDTTFSSVWSILDNDDVELVIARLEKTSLDQTNAPHVAQVLADAMIAGRGQAWRNLSPPQQDRVLRLVCQSASAVTTFAESLGDALTDAQRTWLVQSLMQRDQTDEETAVCAASMLLSFGARLTPEEANALALITAGPYAAHAVANALTARSFTLHAWMHPVVECITADIVRQECQEKASACVARLLHAGASWQPWMREFAPQSADDPKTLALWAEVTDHLPIEVAWIIASLTATQRTARKRAAR